MGFQIKLILLLSMLLQTPKEKVIIYTGETQCSDCVAEIGSFLNKLNVIPCLGYQSTNFPFVNSQKEKVLNANYQEKFNYGFLPFETIPSFLDGIDKFPLVAIVRQSDTVILNLDDLYNENLKLNKSLVKKILQ